MKIIALADIHNGLGYLSDASADLAAADLVLIGGDITNFGGVKNAKLIISELRKCNKNILAVCGNCDSPEVGGYLTDEGININCNRIEFGGINFVGLAGSIDFSRPQLGNTLEEHFTNLLAEIETQTAGNDPLVLVTHQPASRTAVDCRGGGSDAIYDFIERRQPILAVSGHIHEAAGKDTVGNCTLVNPGPFHDGSYASLEINAGQVKNVRIHTL
ncbi:MAG: metallophosphoesterase family protein [Phycisphaerae bacterium]|nr:metallophosphoesterase family protein [Phycisphaerae bacterium]